MHCKDCVNFRQPYNDRFWENFGYCALGEAAGGKPANKETLCYGADIDENLAGMNCSPDFGCVQFVSKNTIGDPEAIIEVNVD